MALDLGHNILTGRVRLNTESAQTSYNVAECIIAGYGVIGVLDPKFDRTAYLTLVSGEDGSIDGDLSLFRHCNGVRVHKVSIRYVRCWDEGSFRKGTNLRVPCCLKPVSIITDCVAMFEKIII